MAVLLGSFYFELLLGITVNPIFLIFFFLFMEQTSYKPENVGTGTRVLPINYKSRKLRTRRDIAK